MDDLRRSALYTTNAMVPNTHGFHEQKIVTNMDPIFFCRQKINPTFNHSRIKKYSSQQYLL